MLQLRLVARTVVAAVVAASLAIATAAAAEPTRATWVVDRDRTQCANADFSSIQAAVDTAQPGDLIKVCPDRYSESVVIDKPLRVKGDPGAIDPLDCFQPSLSELSAEHQAIVDPAGDGFSTGLELAADDVVIEGLVVEGASVGIDAGDAYSGYRIKHNLIQHNALFGIDFGSDGTHRSRVDQNCLRENNYGLVSELDDDSLWKNSDGPEREPWNARDLTNARIDHNDTFRNRSGCCGGGLAASGPGQREQVTFDHNTQREEPIGILLQNATRSAILANDIASSRFFAILIGGANDTLEIRTNQMRGGNTGLRFEPPQFIDILPTPTRNALVSHNDVRDAVAGIYARPASLTESEISHNKTSDNGGNGINMFSSGNLIRHNEADNNVVAGITAFPGATGNRFEHNSMHGNGSSAGASFPGADARDLNPLVNGTLQNVWIGNDCDTDIPAGMICGVG